MRTDSVTLEVLNNYFHAIVADMSHVLRRTAYTTYVKETDDFMSALATPDGEFFMYPKDTGIVHHVGLHLREVLRRVVFEPGDILIFNDPYTSGGMSTHLPDIHLLKPVFAEDQILCFVWSFIHSSDVGGMVPASISPAAVEIYQEGIRIPPVKLYVRGQLQESVRDLVLMNCRIPDDNWGDLRAMVAALNDGERRVLAMVEKFGMGAVREGMSDLLEYAEQRARAIIARIPSGTYRFVDYLEDDVVSDVPIRLVVTMTVKDDNVHLDFTGSEPQVDAAFNLVSGTLNPNPFLAAGLTSFLITEDPSIPINGGIIRPVTMTLPRGSIVNCEFPSPVGVRWAIVVRCFDAILGILAAAVVDGDVPAAGAGQACIVVGSSFDPRRGRRVVNVIEPIQGGSGATANKDGVDGTYYSASLRNTPIESVEAHVPVIVRRYELVADSGGPGKHRGGSAMRIEFEPTVAEFTVQARGQERTRLQPWGVSGGRPGARGLAMLEPGHPGERTIGKINVLKLQAHERIRVQSPGGGGYGDPFEREPERVAADYRSGLVTRDHARTAYGVALTADGLVDDKVTKDLRAGNVRRSGFDFGESRDALDRVWTTEAIARYVGWLMPLPAAIRARARRLLHSEMRSSEGTSHTDPLGSAWSRVRQILELADPQ
jgi:N-methylhydantoinase B